MKRESSGAAAAGRRQVVAMMRWTHRRNGGDREWLPRRHRGDRHETTKLETSGKGSLDSGAKSDRAPSATHDGRSGSGTPET
jgi:hypothetical protein